MLSFKPLLEVPTSGNSRPSRLKNDVSPPPSSALLFFESDLVLTRNFPPPAPLPPPPDPLLNEGFISEAFSFTRTTLAFH